MIRTFTSALFAAFAYAAATDYSVNGDNWAATPGDELCDDGLEQSPIDLVTGTYNANLAIDTEGYRNFAVPSTWAANLSQKVQVPDADQTNTVFTRTDSTGTASVFKPLQFHFHAPSEHTTNGNLHTAEVHIVHYAQGDAGKSPAAVLGFLLDLTETASEANPFVQTIMDSIAAKDDTAITDKLVAIKTLVDSLEGVDFWQYKGSLTTPPCSEGAQWTVLQTPLKITQAQLDWIKETYVADGQTSTNRNVQPLNARTLYTSVDPNAPAASTTDTTGTATAEGATSMTTFAAAVVSAIAALAF